MALTKGEMVICAGRLVTRIGEKLDDPETPNQITLAEALATFNETVQDILKEFAD